MSTEETTQPQQEPKAGQEPNTAHTDLTDQRGWAPEVTVHILNVFEQVHNKISAREVKLTGFEGQLAALKFDINDKIDKTVNDLNKEIVSSKEDLRNEISLTKENINKNIEVSEERLKVDIKSCNDKLGTIKGEEKEIKSQLLAVEERQSNLMSTEITSLEDKLKLFLTQRGQWKSRETFLKTKDVGPSKGLNVALMRKELIAFSDKIVSNISDGLVKLRDKLDCAAPGPVEDRNTTIASIVKGDDKFARLASFIEKQISNSTTEFYRQLKSDLNIVEQDLRESMVNTSDTLESLISTSPKLEDLKHVLKNAISPASCRKGMLAVPNSIIYPSETSVVTVPYVCDTQTDNGGWIIFHRRLTGSLNFYRNWAEYRNGFGSLQGEYWLGLEALHNLTTSGTYELRVDLRYGGKFAYAYYSSFAVASEKEKYVLQLGDYSGTAGDSLSRHRWMAFSTHDKDNDNHGGDCAEDTNGAWWFDNCGGSGISNLNGRWGKTGSWHSTYWRTLTDLNSVSFSEMKLRLLEDYKGTRVT